MAHKKMKAQRYYYGNGRNGWHHHVQRRGGNIVIFAAEKGGVVDGGGRKPSWHGWGSGYVNKIMSYISLAAFAKYVHIM